VKPADVAPGGSAPQASLRETTARGFVWTGGQAVLNRLLSMVGFVVLARLLSPHAYGLVALASVFVALLSLFASAGYSQALVQRPHVDKEDLDTIFWIAIGTSVVLALLLSGAAWPLAAVFHEPDLRPVLQVLSTTFVFIALGSTHQAVLQRRLAFRTIALANLGASVVATAVGIAFAFLGLGVWALVVQSVLGIGVSSLILTAFSGYRPALQVSLARFWPLFEFSRNYFGSTLMTFFNTRTDDFLIGSVLGPAALGIYSVGYRVLQVMGDVLTGTVRQVAFPVFARVQGDKARLERAYRSSMRMCAVGAVPCYAFVLVAAPELVRLVFGAKWEASAPVLRILCLFGALQSVMAFNGALLQSLGRAAFVFRLMMVSTTLQIAGFAISVRYGIQWVATSYATVAYLMAPVNLTAAARSLDSTARATMSGLVAPLISSGLMAAAAVAAKPAFAGAPVGLRVVALAVVAAVVYLTALRLIARSAFDEATGYLRSAVAGRRGRRAAAAAV
jgi:O-antigen/teichoic acid export membrane protein